MSEDFLFARLKINFFFSCFTSGLDQNQSKLDQIQGQSDDFHKALSKGI